MDNQLNLNMHPCWDSIQGHPHEMLHYATSAKWKVYGKLNTAQLRAQRSPTVSHMKYKYLWVFVNLSHAQIAQTFAILPI